MEAPHNTHLKGEKKCYKALIVHHFAVYVGAMSDSYVSAKV